MTWKWCSSVYVFSTFSCSPLVFVGWYRCLVAKIKWWQIDMVAAFADVNLNKVPRVADIEHEV